MRQKHCCLARRTGIAVRRMRGYLLMAHVDELQRAAGHRGEHGNVGVTAQPEHMAHATTFEISNQEFCDGVSHG